MPPVVKINVLSVPAEMRAELERRFAGRAGAVDSADGFEEFQLLRPVHGTDRYLVYTRWSSEEAFQAWHASQDFARGHAQAAGEPHHPPAATGSELWSFEVVDRASKKE